MLNESTIPEFQDTSTLIKELMQDVDDVIDGKCTHMGNSTITKVMVKGNIILKFTSGTLLSLSNMLYVPFPHRNLVSSILLKKPN